VFFSLTGGYIEEDGEPTGGDVSAQAAEDRPELEGSHA
jgi:hypothetical protein